MTSSREPALLRGISAAQAVPYRQAAAQQPSQPVVERRASGDRRTTDRRAADTPVPANRPSYRLGDVYADELGRLRDRAHQEGFAAGYAEGTRAAERAVAEAERAAGERLTELHARWDRRLASAAAALTAAAARLDQASVPTTEELRENVLGAVLSLTEELLGRELAVAEAPALDAVRRALTLCPSDAPVVVRLHPDDLAEIPADALAGLPASVRVVGDQQVERAGAVAEVGAARVDAQLGSALERVRAVLRA